MNFNFNNQAHIIVGPAQNLADHVIDTLQTILCKNNGCNTCARCTQLRQKSHAQILWMEPEKQYTLEQIDSILKAISFARSSQDYFFVIFTQADLLTVACSNRLLKSIEEPSPGYYFLFLTERPKTILPTISSRCVTTYINNFNEDETELPELGKFFTIKNPDPVAFLKYLDKSNINEHETINLVDSLIAHWSKKCKDALINSNEDEYRYSLKLINILSESFLTPPMPGGSKIFWKNLFLKIKN